MQRVFLRRHSTAPALQTNVRRLLRHIAHPVAVVTAPTASTSQHPLSYHGATVSSITSIAMHPIPLMAFALRLPSRLASALKNPIPGRKSDLVVNYLEEHQVKVSEVFARGDPTREPLEDADVPYSLNEDGIPVLDDCLCAMSCKLVTGIPLHNIGHLEGLGGGSVPSTDIDTGEEGAREESEGTDGTNELFIVRVVGIEKMPSLHTSKKPLLYHNTAYTKLATPS